MANNLKCVCEHALNVYLLVRVSSPEHTRPHFSAYLCFSIIDEAFRQFSLMSSDHNISDIKRVFLDILINIVTNQANL